MKEVIYVDNNATTRVDPLVVEEMVPYLSESYGNPSSMHSFGGDVSKKIKEAREKIARLLGADDPREIIFTSCGTESDSTAIVGALKANPDKRHIITTRVEHPAVLNLCQQLEKEGYALTLLPVDSKGNLALNDLRSAIRRDTAIVSIMYANNETGVIFHMEEIGQIVKEREVLFHTDAVQAVGKIPIDMKTSTVDLLSLSGHKLHAPKGVGVLYVRRGTKIRPFLLGGHQEEGRRAGTEAVPNIVALGKAAELALQHVEEENARVKALRDKLEKGILEKTEGSRVNGDTTDRLPNTTNISFEYVEGEAILLHLDEYGICASSGSACTSGSLEPSHVLLAMGVPYTMAHGSIRFSLSRFNTEEEIDFIIEKVPPIINKLRKISPFTKMMREKQRA